MSSSLVGPFSSSVSASPTKPNAPFRPSCIAEADEQTEWRATQIHEPLKRLGVEDAKIRQKILRLLKKYQGRCGQRIRWIFAYNSSRGKLARRRREEKLQELSQ